MFPGAPDHYDLMHSEWWKVRKPMQEAFMERLRRGTLRATGFELPLSISSVRKRIDPELWKLLEPDFETSEARGPGTKIVNIEITEETGVVVPVERERDAEIRSKFVSLSDDDRVLKLGEHTITLRGEIQQTIMRQLVQAYPKGEHLRTAKVLSEAGSNADSLAKAFKGSRHWQILRLKIRQKSGMCWLEP
jgi:hypothetical protein